MTRRRLALFYAIVVFASLAVALLVGELFARSLAMSTGDGGGRAAKRWGKEHWKPINAHKYRDLEWADPGELPAVVFLGDSFTDGHGVVFDQTFAHRVRTGLAGRAVAYNLGRSGSSTRDEARNYREFRRATRIKPSAVVLQYFGNDMKELLPPAPQWTPWPGLETLSRHSDLAELLWVYMDGVQYGRLYADHNLDAYATPVYDEHRRELERLFRTTHRDGARMVFMVFPYLDNEEYLERSQPAYIERMRVLFRAQCASGDVFVDVSPLAKTFPLAQRTVNRLDGHPSPALHAAVGDLLLRQLQAESAAPAPGVEACGNHG